MTIAEMFSRFRDRKSLMRNLETQEQAHFKLDERKKSANEREMLKFIKEQRESDIKKTVDEIRRLKQDEFWHKDVISQKPLFNDNSHNVLHQNNLFKGTHKPVFKRGEFL